MSTATIYSRALSALETPCVTVEVHLSNGLPAFNLVGMPETAVKESKDRVRSAIINSNFEFPAKRITVNLAPADLPKGGGRFDLAIAIGILAASGQVKSEQLNQYECLGELGLSGDLRPVKGTINAVNASMKAGRTPIIPIENGPEAQLAISDGHYIAKSLLAVCAHLNQTAKLEAYSQLAPRQHLNKDTLCLSEIKGQQQAKRALEIAAAGQHNLLYSGPPGCGKSMLAKRLPGLLPDMTTEESLQTLAIRSLISASPDLSQWQTRPFRAPHHSASSAALVGGGNPPRPGEISLAHNGILFLDELPEFHRPVLEALREPLENGHICISRANQHAQFPAEFQLIAAMNPCPCGYYGSIQHHCRCNPDQVQRYRNKISGPLLDRIDLHLTLQPTPIKELTDFSSQPACGESSEQIRQRITLARELQLARQGATNAKLGTRELKSQANISRDALDTFEIMAEKIHLSARAMMRTLKVARTIADLQQDPEVSREHIIEACSYRSREQVC